MNRCPSDTVRWCVTSLAEKLKCEDMIMAFKAKELKPEMDCLYGGNSTNCMEMIWRGDADLINLDAGDIYIAGRLVQLALHLEYHLCHHKTYYVICGGFFFPFSCEHR